MLLPRGGKNNYNFLVHALPLSIVSFFALRLKVFYVIVSGLKLSNPLHGALGRASTNLSAQPQNDGAAKKLCLLDMIRHHILS